MNRRQRNYTPHLSAEWSRLFPHRPEKKDFSDEIICAVNVIMRQIDPDGRRPIIEPPMPAEGYEASYSVQSSNRQKPSEE